jgi:hypothetical protein
MRVFSIHFHLAGTVGLRVALKKPCTFVSKRRQGQQTLCFSSTAKLWPCSLILVVGLALASLLPNVSHSAVQHAAANGRDCVASPGARRGAPAEGSCSIACKRAARSHAQQGRNCAASTASLSQRCASGRGMSQGVPHLRPRRNHRSQSWFGTSARPERPSTVVSPHECVLRVDLSRLIIVRRTAVVGACETPKQMTANDRFRAKSGHAPGRPTAAHVSGHR